MNLQLEWEAYERRMCERGSGCTQEQRIGAAVALSWVESRLSQAERERDDLLARIFRDGGQRAAELGDKAVAEADKVVAALFSERDEARALAERLAEALRREVVFPRSQVLGHYEELLAAARAAGVLG